MKVKVKLFAFLAEAKGDTLELDLPQKTTFKEIKTKIAGDDQALKVQLDGCRIAINQEFVLGEELELKPNDEIAIIPPVSGG